MTLNLRTEEPDDGAIERIATTWGVSKNQAILRAVHLIDQQLDHRERVDSAIERVVTEDAELLERLRRA